jgi:hypothetical protein
MSYPNSFYISPENMRARCEALVIALLGKKMAQEWWNSSNETFNGSTPEQIYSLTPIVVYNYLMNLDNE